MGFESPSKQLRSALRAAAARADEGQWGTVEKRLGIADHVISQDGVLLDNDQLVKTVKEAKFALTNRDHALVKTLIQDALGLVTPVVESGVSGELCDRCAKHPASYVRFSGGGDDTEVEAFCSVCWLRDTETIPAMQLLRRTYRMIPASVRAQ
jgi:hypothetical protein